MASTARSSAAIMERPGPLSLFHAHACIFSSTIIVFGYIAYFNMGTLDYNRKEGSYETQRYADRENVGGYDLLLRALLGSIAIVILAMTWWNPAMEMGYSSHCVHRLFTGMTRHCTLMCLWGSAQLKRRTKQVVHHRSSCVLSF